MKPTTHVTYARRRKNPDSRRCSPRMLCTSAVLPAHDGASLPPSPLPLEQRVYSIGERPADLLRDAFPAHLLPLTRVVVLPVHVEGVGLAVLPNDHPVQVSALP